MAADWVYTRGEQGTDVWLAEVKSLLCSSHLQNRPPSEPLSDGLLLGVVGALGYRWKQFFLLEMRD